MSGAGAVHPINGRLRDELLNETLFYTARPHSALGYLTPAAYAANFTATDDRLRNPDQFRRSNVAPTAPQGVKPAEALIAAG